MPTAVDDPTPSPTPTPSPRGPLGLLGFRPPSSPPSPESPSEWMWLGPEDLENLDGFGLDSDPDEWDEASSPESPAGTSSRASTPAPEVEALDSEGLRDMARAGVAIAGHQAHEHIAREGGQKAVGLYLTDEEDQAGIGDPLARIAARHQGVGKVSPDTQDLLAALVSIARYGTKQISLAKTAKQLDLAGAGTPQPMPHPAPVDL